jgi:hypothetical protein
MQSPRGAQEPLSGVEIDATTRACLVWLQEHAGYRQNVAIAEGVELLQAFVVALAAGGGPVRLPYPRQLPNGAPAVLTLGTWRGLRRWRGWPGIIVALLLGVAVGLSMGTG